MGVTVLLGLRFDLRAAPGGPEHGELYAAALELCERGDRLFDGLLVTLSEHHGSPDGYLPSPLVLAAAICGRSPKAHVIVAAVLPPLHDVLRLAEDLAVLDLATGGRVDVILGAGYRYEEFDMFGVDITRRGELMDEAVTTLRQAWTGEPFEFRGRTVRVTPRPLRRPHPPVLLGGSSPAAARRAARLADFFVPTTTEVWDAYCEELERLGQPALPCPLEGRPPSITLVHRDPDAAWAAVGEHLLHDTNTYAAWLRDGRGSTGPYAHADSVDQLRREGRYLIVTPDECIELAREHGMVDLHPLVGGLPPALALGSMDLLEEVVLPALTPPRT